MSTLRTLISSIRSSHKLLSIDNLITNRAIASEIRIARNLLVKRETNLRKLWATDTLYTTIPCLELITVPISECCDYVDECEVARSKFKLPRIGEGNYQYVIQGVYGINALSGTSTKFKEVTLNRYTNILKLPLIKKDEYYFIVNDYLYVTNPLLQSVRFVAYFEEDVPNEIMFPKCDCANKESLDNICKNPLDREFAIPGYLEKQVMDLVSDKLIKTYFNLKSDNTSDDIDGQSPNSKSTN